MNTTTHRTDKEDYSFRGWILSHKWVVVLFSIVSMVGMMLSFTLGSSSSNPFLPYYEAYSADHLQENLTRWEREIVNHYRNQEYESALWMLEQYCDESQASIDFRLMLGSSYLEVGKPHLAVQIFSDIAQMRAIRVQRKGLWYLAIAQIKSGDHKSAHQSLTKLLDDPGEYRESAHDLQGLLIINE